jgi:hypothetical protein
MSLTLWIVGLFSLSIGVLLIAALVAPEGYEDEHGFHLGEPKKRIKPMRINGLTTDFTFPLQDTTPQSELLAKATYIRSQPPSPP